MFYYNTKYRFSLPADSPTNIAGSIIAAAGMPSWQLLRRDVRKQSHLQHRLFDPQLYLASLDKNMAAGPVKNLASYPWFTTNVLPEYDSDAHGTMQKFKAANEQALLDAWAGRVTTDSGEIRRSAAAAIKFQLDLGCEAIILPSPLTTVVAPNYQVETEWIDAGLAAAHDLRVSVPMYATVAVSDAVLRGADPFAHPLLHTITNQVAARQQLAGAYIVIEQASEAGYVCTSRDTLIGVLVMIDDLVRGAARQVIVNYMGSFGPICSAAGASVWSSGYYLGQRRLKLADFDEKIAFSLPRYFSMQLAGDVGLEQDLAWMFSKGFGKRVFSVSRAAGPLLQAMENGTYPDSVPQWEYRQTNIAAASAHYIELMQRFGVAVDGFRAKLDLASRWLTEAVALVDRIRAANLRGSKTELLHQRVWLDALTTWRGARGL
jgi:hypothetical protein